MGIVVKSNTVADFHKAMRARLEKASFDILSRAGETAVTYARAHGTYTDRTSNLRNSVGYVIMNNGAVVSGKFATGVGSTTASAYATEIATTTAVSYPKGWVLIVVAGMEYAAYVEAKGFDVLSGAGNVLRADIAKIVQQIKEELKA